MSTLEINIPESLRKQIEEIAMREGYTVSQFLTSAAGEKLAAISALEYLREQARAGRREDFDRYLAAVPDAEPIEGDRPVGSAPPQAAAAVAYYLNRRAQANGDHELHRAGCAYLPPDEGRISLGEHADGAAALQKAKEHAARVNACYYCLPEYHLS